MISADSSAASPAALLVNRLVAELGKKLARRALTVALGKFSTVELAALAANWDFWARPKQIAPPSFRSWGFLAARGFGKTLAAANHINGEVAAGRAMLVGLAAQDEANSIAIQVLGPSGLVATAPPWFKPTWHATSLQLVWPNGARAYVRTPEVPGKIRGLEYHLSWISELQSWSAATRQSAFDNFLLSTRLGYARLIWDATPKRRHPILRELLKQSELDSTKHVVVRGATQENADNLGDGYVEELVKKWGGTQKGREELGGEMLDDDDDGLVKQVILDTCRRHLPDHFSRKAIGIDPAVTDRQGSDRTGINLSGLGTDDRLYVLADLSGKHTPGEWATIVLDTYTREECDLVVVETNKGGNLLTQNLRAGAGARGLVVVVVDAKWRPHRIAGTVFVREIHSRGEKADRAQPLATAYERGRVSHVIGRDLVALEEILTTWVPESGQRSPDPLEALVHVAGELLGLANETHDARADFKGIAALATALEKAPSRLATANLAMLFGGAGTSGSGRI